MLPRCPCRYQVEREIRIHISLQHENIIRLHVAFEDEKNVYMVQEFATGGDLFEDLKKGGGQMKEGPTATNILIPFLSSLAYLHGMVSHPRVAHYDPGTLQNVLVCDGTGPNLCDTIPSNHQNCFALWAPTRGCMSWNNVLKATNKSTIFSMIMCSDFHDLFPIHTLFQKN